MKTSECWLFAGGVLGGQAQTPVESVNDDKKAWNQIFKIKIQHSCLENTQTNSRVAWFTFTYRNKFTKI